MDVERSMDRRFGMFGVAAALLIAQAAAQAAVAPEVVQALAHKSSLWTQMESLGAQVRAGMARALSQGAGAPGEAVKARVLGCADTAYGADAMRATALDAVAGALRPDDVPALIAWFDSPLGAKVASQEQATATQATDPAERMRLGDEALRTASAQRKASLQAIITETHSVEIMADTAIEMAVAVRQGAASADPSASASAMAGIRDELSARRLQIVARYAQISLPAYAFAYSGLNDDELKRYADYLATPAAQAYRDGSERGVARALVDGSTKLGRCLKDAGAAKAP
jgi:hypothetical protein